MELLEVKSSNIARVGYDPESLTLGVQFLGGNVYHYLDVPQEVHAAMMATESKGKFFASQIKPRFKCQKVDASNGTVKPEKPASEKTILEMVLPKREAKSTPDILLPTTALAISFEAGADAIGFPALPFEQMVANLRHNTQQYCAPVLAKLVALTSEALTMTVTDAASYEAAAAKGKQLADQRRLLRDLLKKPKQSIDSVKDVFLDQEKELLGTIEPGESHLEKECTEWRKADKARATAAAVAERDQKKADAEEKRLSDAQKAMDSGRTGLADRLLSTPVPTPKVEVRSDVPKTSAKPKTIYKYRIVDQNAIPDIFWVLDEKAIAAHARTKKYADGTVIDGIEFYQEEDTNF